MNTRKYGVLGGLILTMALGGCRMFSDSFETVAQLEQKGDRPQALLAYQNYLNHHPHSALTSKIYLKMAELNQEGSHYDSAITWYQRVVNEFPDSIEAPQALFGIADLYRNQLRDPAKSDEWSEKALSRYLADPQARAAVQTVILSKFSSAMTLFYQRKYPEAGELVRVLVEGYPSSMVLPEQRAKVEALKDRIRRAEMIANGDSLSIKLLSETPFNISFSNDFTTAPDALDSGLLSPDGQYLISRKKAKNDVFYLYLGKVMPGANAVTFTLLPQTFGAEAPVWAPDSQSLIFERVVGKKQKLEKLSIGQKILRSLFFAPASRIPDIGVHPAFHPSGNKIAFVFAGRIWVMNADGLNKCQLKTAQKFDYTSQLSWSFDGTLIRCKQSGTPAVDELLNLDSALNFP